MAITSKPPLTLPDVPLLVGRTKTTDPAENNQVFSLLYDYEMVQLKPGHFGCGLEFAATSRATLYSDQYGGSLHCLGVMLGDQIGLCIPVSNSSDAVWWGQSIKKTQVPLGRSGKAVHVTFHPGQQNLVAIIDRQFCIERWQRPGFAAPPDIDEIFNRSGQQFLSVDTAKLDRWRVRLANLLSRNPPGPVTLQGAAFENEILTAFRSLLESAEECDVKDSVARKLVESALDHVELAGPRGAAVADLCAELNVSRRTLEVAFRNVIGMSPLKYLTQRRLCRAFTSLKQASPDETSVTDVALVHGFHELGRFAGRYQELFGELPRETLRQRPTRSGRMPAGL